MTKEETEFAVIATSTSWCRTAKYKLVFMSWLWDTAFKQRYSYQIIVDWKVFAVNLSKERFQRMGNADAIHLVSWLRIWKPRETTSKKGDFWLWLPLLTLTNFDKLKASVPRRILEGRIYTHPPVGIVGFTSQRDDEAVIANSWKPSCMAVGVLALGRSHHLHHLGKVHRIESSSAKV